METTVIPSGVNHVEIGDNVLYVSQKHLSSNEKCLHYFSNLLKDLNYCPSRSFILFHTTLDVNTFVPSIIFKQHYFECDNVDDEGDQCSASKQVPDVQMDSQDCCSVCVLEDFDHKTDECITANTNIYCLG